MIVLRPLLMLYGTLHVEGGSRGDKERRAGDVVAAGYFRQLARVTALHIRPWGRLVDPANLRKVKDLIAQATVDVASFNAGHSKCRVENTLVWEHLRGNMKDAVTGWVDRKLRDEDVEVMNAIASLTTSSSDTVAA